MKNTILLFALSSSLTCFAQSTFVELPDGRKIVIKENKTWDMVEKVESSKDTPSNNDPSNLKDNIWSNDNISINIEGWDKSKVFHEMQQVAYVNEKRDNYFIVYEEIVDIALSKYISITIKQNQKQMKKVKIEKQLSFQKNGRSHAQVTITAEVEELPVIYVYTFFAIKGGYATIVGWTIGKNTSVIEGLRNRVTLKN